MAVLALIFIIGVILSKYIKVLEEMKLQKLTEHPQLFLTKHLFQSIKLDTLVTRHFNFAAV